MLPSVKIQNGGENSLSILDYESSILVKKYSNFVVEILN
jgi:hypothetical protein